MMYSLEDIGCYGDGALGHEHVRKNLACLVLEFSPRLCKLLWQAPSDDLFEETQALEVLNAHTQFPAVWEFVDGNLLLTVAAVA